MTYKNNCLTSVTNPEGETTTYTYDRENRILSETNDMGITYVRNIYDDIGRVIQQSNASGEVMTLEYINEEESINATSGSSIVAATGSSVETRRIVMKDALGRRSEMWMNYTGRVIKKVDANGHQTCYTYDEAGNTTSITNACGDITSSTYDKKGNLLTMTDNLGNTITY